MEKTLRIINQMQQEGIFQQYAIGGGIAAIFYIEPVVTFDLDVFVILPEQNDILLSLSPIYDWLHKKGYSDINEQILIEGIPVQFIPVYNELVREAVENAEKKEYNKVDTFVIKPEYLLVIMLQTNRPKDKERIIVMLEEAKLSVDLLERILVKYNLKNQFNKFKDILNG